MSNNYYLDLLYKKVMELKKVLKEAEEKEYSSEQIKYLISGYIITLDSILEIGISDLHSSELDDLTSLIYYTRQKAVHYGYFNGLHNISDIANKIIDLTESLYENEKKFHSALLSTSNYLDRQDNNIVIKSSQNIRSSQNFYHLTSLDGTKELCIPLTEVFTLTKKSKEKVSNYIINTDSPVSLFTLKDGQRTEYIEINDNELKNFIKENFTFVDENYSKHTETIGKIINSFLTDPINSIQIMEYASNEQFCKNTIEVIKEFILERTMFDAYIEHYHLIKDKYSINKMQKADYTKLQNNFRKNILQYTTQKDAFFINMTLQRTKYYLNILHDEYGTFELPPQILCPILIQLFETGPKHFSSQFISSSPEFKKCYSNLLRYRQIFSHYLLDGKEYKDNVNKFRDEFLSFVNILDLIDLNDVRIPVAENYETYSILERNKKDFFNYKHEQYLRIEDNSYIGKKIFYSSKNPTSENLIAIIPYGNNASNTLYYEKDAYDYLKPLYTYDENTGKKSYIPVSKHALGDTKQVKIDFNLSNLFKAYSILKKVKPKGDITIHFVARDENDHYSHYDHLENVILRFFIQGYLPAELLRKTSLNLNSASQGILTLIDENGKTIANIINNKKRTSPYSEENKDEKSFFSRIDHINHNFSKRRHSR